jgi:hypothetical protein
MPAFVNIGAVGCVGMSPDDGTALWPWRSKNSSHARRSSLAVIRFMADTAY